MRRPLILVGAGGHALSCVAAVEASREYVVKGFVIGSSRDSAREKSRYGYPILGTDDELPHLIKKWRFAFVAIGQIESPDRRITAFTRLQDLCAVIPTIVAPASFVSSRAAIGSGTAVLGGAVVNAGAIVGENVILNSQSLIEHGASIGSHTHVSTGVIVNGDATVGEGSFIGSGSVVFNGVDVGRRCLVPAGSVVTRDLADGERWLG